MSKYFVCLLLIFTLNGLYAQKVGVNTSTPAATLDVNAKLTLNNVNLKVLNISSDSSNIISSVQGTLPTQSAVKGFIDSKTYINKEGFSDPTLTYIDSIGFASPSFVKTFVQQNTPVLAVGSFANDKVCFYNISNPETPILTDCVTQFLDGPTDVIYEPTAVRVYITSFNNDNVHRYNSANLNDIVYFNTFSLPGLDGPNSIDFVESGSYFAEIITSKLNNKAFLYLNQELINVIEPKQVTTWNPGFVHMIFIACGTGNNVRVFAKEAAASTFTSLGAITSAYNNPEDVYVQDDILYISYKDSDIISAYRLGYNESTNTYQVYLIDNYSSELDAPTSLFVREDHTVISTSANNDKIVVYNGDMVKSLNQNIDNPVSLAEMNGYIYVASQNNNGIIIIKVDDTHNRTIGLNSDGQIKDKPAIWRTSTSDHVYTEYANIGIGVSNPSQGLNVAGGSIHLDVDEQSVNNLDYGLKFGATTGEGIIKNSGIPKFQFFTGHLPRFTLLNIGDAGIGITNPTALGLSVDGGITLNAVNLSNGTLNHGIKFGGYNSGEGIASKRTSGGNQYGIDIFTNHTPRISITNSGRVGFGTTNPTKAKVEVVGFQTHDLNAQYGYLNSSNPTGIVSNASPESYSIWAANRVAASEFNAFSDIRIKNKIGISNSKDDLEKIRKLAVTDYKMIDSISEGRRTIKKFIAQEVEEVLPNAVSKAKNFIPNIFRQGVVNGNFVELSQHCLIVGDKVKLIFDKSQSEFEVTSINDNGFYFKAESNEPGSGPVFVYGKQVDDFLSLDYNQIFSTSISAIQNLLQENEKLKLEIDRAVLVDKYLEEKINNLKTQLNSIKSKN